jgi:hypothetical protein
MTCENPNCQGTKFRYYTNVCGKWAKCDSCGLEVKDVRETGVDRPLAPENTGRED